jgi:hypothetical protein
MLDTVGALRSDRPAGGVAAAGRILLVLLAAALAGSGAAALPAPVLAAPSPTRTTLGVPDTTVAIRLTPTPDEVAVGLPIAFTVEAVAADGKGSDVTGSATVRLDGDFCKEAICTPLEAGSHRVTAEVSADELNLFSAAHRFVAREVSEVDLEPAEKTVRPGETVQYHARAYAQPGDDVSPRLDLGDVTGVTRFELDGKPCAGSECRAGTRLGTHRVSGTVKPVEREPVTGDATLVVEQGRPRSLTLEPGERTVTVGAAVTYKAVTDDGAGTLTDVSKLASFEAGPRVSCAGPVCTPQQPGRYTVTASVGEKPPVTATATLIAEAPRPVALRLEPATARIAVRAAQPYRAYGIGADEEDLGEVTARTVFRIDKGGTCNPSGCGAAKPGTYMVTGSLTDDADIVGTAALTVDPLPATSIRLVAPRGPIAAGATRTYRAIAVDDEGRDVGNVTDKARLSIRDTPPAGGRIGSCDGPRCGADQAGDYVVTGRVPGIRGPGRAALTVVPATLARVALAPAQASIAAGAEQAYTVEGFDAYGNDVGELTARATFAIPDGGSCQDARCTSDRVGTYAVSATVRDPETGRAVTGTAVLSVDTAELASVRLSPTSARVLAGADQPYTAVGFDAFGNPRGDVTDRTSFTIDPAGTCAAGSCSAESTGPYTVTGTVTGADVAGGEVSETAALRVDPGRPATLVLEPQQATVVTGGVEPYTARGFDAFGNDAGDLTARTLFTISPAGSCRGAICSAPTPRTYTVTGTLADAEVHGTAGLTVLAGSPTRLELDPPQRTLAPGAEQAYRAVGYDGAGVSLGDVTSRTMFTIEDGECAGAVCSADRAGDHRVTARLAGSDVTGTARLTVRADPPAVARLVLDPANGAIAIGSRQAYSARGFDAGGNDRGDVTARTTFSIEPDGDCAGRACWAESPGPHRVVGQLSGTAIRQAVTLDVTPTLPNRLVLEPATATAGTGGLQSYRVRAIDQDGADLGDASGRTVLMIGDGGFCRGLACGARRPGTFTVAAVPVDGGWVAHATLRVTAAAPVALVLSPASTSAQRPATQAYQARGLDAAGNDLGDMTARTAFTIEPNGSCTAAVCTSAQPGDHTVTGRITGTAVAASATLRVLAPLTPVDDHSGTGRPDWVLLVGGGLLVAAAARSALGRARQRLGRPHEQQAAQAGTERDGDWVRHNVRTVPSPGQVTPAVRPRERRPDVVLRLEAHSDTDTTDPTEEG